MPEKYDLAEVYRASYEAFCVVFAVLHFLLLCAPSAYAQSIEVEIGKSIVLNEASPIGEVFIADPSIADVNPAGEDVFVFGRSAGQTTLITNDLSGQSQTIYNVTVSHPISELQLSISQRFPDSDISLVSSRGSLMIQGTVKDSLTHETLLATVQSAIPDVALVDRVRVRASDTIWLELRMLEVNRETAQTFGVDVNALLAGTGWFVGVQDRGVIRLGSGDEQSRIDAAIDVLVNNNIATVNQLTQLSTVIDEPARFSVGGEIPIPDFVPQENDPTSGNFRISYKFVGTELIFTPQRTAGEKLHLRVQSQLSSERLTAGVVNGNSFPNLASRSFETTVEVNDGQSFVIAGLSKSETLQDRRDSNGTLVSQAINSVFGSDAESAKETELVVIVTPYTRERAPRATPSFVSRRLSNLSHILGSVAGDKFGSDQSDEIGGFRF